MPIDLPKHLRAEAQRAEFIIELVKSADKLNNLEQAEAESLARIEDYRKGAEAIEAECADRIKRADERVAKALGSAAQAVADAKAEAEQIVARAKTEAENLTANGRAALAALDAELTTSKQAVEDAKAVIAALAEQYEGLRNQADAAIAVIAKAEAIKKVMG
jgi:DNA repair exonuclease SbcCD ATPase subunit